PERKMRGYTINGLYYPIGLGPRWIDLVAKWREAQGDPAKLKTFVNDRLAEPWEDPAMRAVKHNVIADRAEPYRLRTAPLGVLAVTAGVDTQDNRLAVHIVGWSRGLACWILDYVELPGDPADDQVWADLTALLNRGIQHARGGLVRRPLCSFGAVPNNAPVLSKGRLQDLNWRNQVDKRGVMIHHVGTVGIKHWLYARLSTDADKTPDTRLVHFSDELSADYIGGLVSETYNP